MKSRRRSLLALTALVGAAAALLSVQTGGALGGRDGSKIRWDITTVTPGPTITAGGSAAALAVDGSKITLTGSGTFKPGEDDEVTGGGTWQTSTASGTLTASGTYKVTGLVAWHEASGTLPPGANDTIGRSADARSGLAVLQIRYSDGSGLGKLVVSCHLPVGAPDSIFEGITASKTFTDYFDPEPGTTIFHVLREDNDDDDND